MNNNFKLIVFLFFISKVSLKRHFTNLGLLRTNSQCDDACESCNLNESPQCLQCKDGYSLNDKNECHLNMNNPSQPHQSCKTMLYEMF